MNEVKRCAQHQVPHNWISCDSEEWRRMPCRHQCMIVADGSLRNVACKYAACGWVVQVVDGDDILRYGMYDTILVS